MKQRPHEQKYQRGLLSSSLCDLPLSSPLPPELLSQLPTPLWFLTSFHTTSHVIRYVRRRRRAPTMSRPSPLQPSHRPPPSSVSAEALPIAPPLPPPPLSNAKELSSWGSKTSFAHKPNPQRTCRPSPMYHLTGKCRIRLCRRLSSACVSRSYLFSAHTWIIARISGLLRR